MGKRTRLKSIHKLNDDNDSLRDAHLNYIGKTLNGLTGVSSKLTKEDTSILGKYGAWMEALLKKEIQPFTEAQKKFIEKMSLGGVVEGYIKGDTIFEEAWINFERECRYIKKRGQREELEDPRFIPSSRLENEFETHPHSTTEAYDINRDDEYDWRDDYGEDS